MAFDYKKEYKEFYMPGKSPYELYCSTGAGKS